LFSAQILVGLYRYNAKLATFCESRADLLQMLSVTAVDSVDVLKSTLIPVDVEFDKQRSPRVPDIAKALADIVSEANKKQEGHRRTGADEERRLQFTTPD
jgi:hypothetical protein